MIRLTHKLNLEKGGDSMADFPRVKWVNFDGNTIPFTEPQHFTGNGDETVRTGHDNPLPVANYTQNESGLWLPTSKENPMPTQITGSNVELIRSLKDNKHFEEVGRLIVLGDNISSATANAYPIISPSSHLSIYLNNNGSHNFWIERFYFTNSSDIGSYMHFLDGLKLEVAPGESAVYTSEDLGIENIQFVGFFLWLRAESNNYEGTIDVDIIASKD